MCAEQSDEESDAEQPQEEIEPDVPEPERDAALEEAYKLEKEDADSDEEVSDDDDDEDDEENNEAGETAGVELTKEQKRELEVS